MFLQISVITVNVDPAGHFLAQCLFQQKHKLVHKRGRIEDVNAFDFGAETFLKGVFVELNRSL